MRRKKWIHAIRRDEGQDFSITKNTKGCSRHFREYDFVKTLSGRTELRTEAVPSKFAWICTSPRKRKAPTARENLIESSQTPRLLFEEPESNEELYSTDVLENDAASSQISVSDENVKLDVETQTTEFKEYNATLLTQKNCGN